MLTTHALLAAWRVTPYDAPPFSALRVLTFVLMGLSKAYYPHQLLFTLSVIFLQSQ